MANHVFHVSMSPCRRVDLQAKKGGGGGKAEVKEDTKKGGKTGGGGQSPEDLAKIEKEAKTDAVGLLAFAWFPTSLLFFQCHQEDRMKKTISALGDSFNTIRTGRANAAILDKIMV